MLSLNGKILELTTELNKFSFIKFKSQFKGGKLNKRACLHEHVYQDVSP